MWGEVWGSVMGVGEGEKRCGEMHGGCGGR